MVGFYCNEKGCVQMGTFIVGSIVLIIMGIAIRSIIKDRKNGKACGCGQSCKGCSGHCNH